MVLISGCVFLASLAAPATLLAQEATAPGSSEELQAQGAAPPEPPESSDPTGTPPESSGPTGTVPEPPSPKPPDGSGGAEPAPSPSPAPAAAETEPEQEPAPSSRGARSSQGGAQAAGSASVTILDFRFSPDSTTVNVGDTVSWFNEGPTPHSATADEGSFDTGILKKGQSGSHTFTEPGTFSYHCTPHPWMKATVKVVSAGGGGGGGGGGAAGASGGTGAAAPTEEEAVESPGAAGSSSRLPATGLQTLALALLGAVLLVLGGALRRQATGG